MCPVPAPAAKLDAVVFFTPPSPDAPSVAATHGAFDAADSLPRGPVRRQVVFDALQTIANESYRQAAPLLAAQNIHPQAADRLWMFNGVRVHDVTQEQLDALKGPLIARVETPVAPDAQQGAALLTPPKPQSAAPSPPAGGGTTPAQPDDPNTVWMDWGTAHMGAPEAWKQGITGAGIVVGSLDTGVDVDHPGLRANWRGTQRDGSQRYAYNWAATAHGAPNDRWTETLGHGTHTIGSVLGNDATHLTGVAPDAKFVAVDFATDLGATENDFGPLYSGMQWMLAPTDEHGENPRPALGVDIVANSWAVDDPQKQTVQQGFIAWQKAGIIPIVDAGNVDPPGPGNVLIPNTFPEAITVGNSDQADKPAPSSAYGPSPDAPGMPKPEVMAPGEKIYSTMPDGRYHDTILWPDGSGQDPISGTSMSSPHVSGAVALYLQAHPNASFDEIRRALEQAGSHASTSSQVDGYGVVQVGKLITPESIDRAAHRTPRKRVDQLNSQLANAKIYPGDPPGGGWPMPPIPGM